MINKHSRWYPIVENVPLPILQRRENILHPTATQESSQLILKKWLSVKVGLKAEVLGQTSPDGPLFIKVKLFIGLNKVSHCTR